MCEHSSDLIVQTVVHLCLQKKSWLQQWSHSIWSNADNCCPGAVMQLQIFVISSTLLAKNKKRGQAAVDAAEETLIIFFF